MGVVRKSDCFRLKKENRPPLGESGGLFASRGGSSVGFFELRHEIRQLCDAFIEHSIVDRGA